MSRVAAALVATILLASAIPLESQAGRQVNVVLEFQQQGQDSRQGAQGRASGVIIQDGKARVRGGVAVQDTTTRTTRSEGVFTIAQDGGPASMLMATEVPSTEVCGSATTRRGRGTRCMGRPGSAWAPPSS